MWKGRAWGHPLFLVNCRDLPVEPDTVPLHLLRQDAAPPRELGEVVAGSPEIARFYAVWLQLLQPNLWKEFQQMANASTPPYLTGRPSWKTPTSARSSEAWV